MVCYQRPEKISEKINKILFFKQSFKSLFFVFLKLNEFKYEKLKVPKIGAYADKKFPILTKM
jgi:hypothetical protein